MNMYTINILLSIQNTGASKLLLLPNGGKLAEPSSAQHPIIFRSLFRLLVDSVILLRVTVDNSKLCVNDWIYSKPRSR